MEQKRNLFEIFMTHAKGEDKTDMNKKSSSKCYKLSSIAHLVFNIRTALCGFFCIDEQWNTKQTITYNNYKSEDEIKSLALLCIEIHC